MNLTAEFLAAAVPAPRRILGVDLRPFSLGHLLLMQWLANSFVSGGKPGVEDLVTGVWVCSLCYAEALKALRSGRIDMVERGRWRTRRSTVPLTSAFQRWRDVAGPFDVSAKCVEFSAYLKAGCQVPTVATTRGENSDNAAAPIPEVQSVKVTLMSRMHIPEVELMDRPWSLCLWDCYTLSAHDGSVKFLDGDSLAEAQSTADKLKVLIDSGKVKL